LPAGAGNRVNWVNGQNNVKEIRARELPAGSRDNWINGDWTNEARLYVLECVDLSLLNENLNPI